jgi:enoyl-CoA hydratase
MSDEEFAAAALVERQDRVLLVHLTRPAARNAINSEMTAIVLDAMDQLNSDDSLSVGVLTGSGQGFSSGMDLKEFAARGTPKGLDALLRNGSAKPLVAAVDGFCLAGGLELALTCDMIVASERSLFGIPETQVGLFAAGGGVIRLPRRLPYSVAAQMALTADPITAQQAHEHGLVNLLVDDGQALAHALTLANRVARNAPLALTASKAMLQAALGHTEADLWEMQIPLIRTVFRSGDAKEGPQAFAQKRMPEWTGS